MHAVIPEVTRAHHHRQMRPGVPRVINLRDEYHMTGKERGNVQDYSKMMIMANINMMTCKYGYTLRDKEHTRNNVLHEQTCHVEVFE